MTMQSISLEPDETGFDGRMRDLAMSAKPKCRHRPGLAAR